MKQTLYLPKHLNKDYYYEKYRKLSHHKENLITLYPYKTNEGKWECFLENTYQQNYISLYPIIVLCFDKNGVLIDKINIGLNTLEANETKLINIETKSEVENVKLKLPHVLIDQSKQPLPSKILDAVSKVLYEKQRSMEAIEYIPLQIKHLDPDQVQVKLIISNNSFQTQTIHQLPMQITDKELIAEGTFKFDNLRLLPYSCQITQVIFSKSKNSTL